MTIIVFLAKSTATCDFQGGMGIKSSFIIIFLMLVILYFNMSGIKRKRYKL